MATTPGAFAVLVGAGVSAEAGVPSGGEILRLTKRKLYATANPSSSEPSEDDLAEWLRSEGLSDLGYSALLEAALPIDQTRRDFVAGFFSGRSPGPAHVALARLAERGLVRTIVTTNFDHLIEDALTARGLPFVMVSDDAGLETAPHRETAPIFLVKAHGDAGQLTIRNTPQEVETLDPRMTDELKEIAERHGVISLGYAGRDGAINGALRKTSPRFGLYWLTRPSGTTAQAEALVAQASGKIISRSGAGDFLAELERRVSGWLSDPSGGMTAHLVRSRTITALERGSPVALAELLKTERDAFVRTTHRAVTAAAEAQVGPEIDTERMARLDGELSSALERRLASLLPLIQHDHRTFIRGELPWLGELADQSWTTPAHPYAAFGYAPRLLGWMLLYACGAMATREHSFDLAKALWSQRADRGATPMPAIKLGAAAELAGALELSYMGKRAEVSGVGAA